ncbi:MAG: hypothetical protein ACYCZF_01770 [Anaerolineae bacterium]
MKLRRLVIIGTLVLLAMVLFVVPVAAEGKYTYVTGTIQMQPYPPGMWFPDDVVIELPDGTFLIEGYSYDIVKNRDPRLSGFETLHYYITADADFAHGTIWSNIEIVNRDGTWSGKVVGTMDNNNWSTQGFWTGNGAFSGLVAKLDYKGYQEGGNYNRVWDVTGYIIEKDESESVAVPAETASWPVTGSLIGNHGGAFARYAFTFNSTAPVTLVMHMMPYDMVIANGAGFTVYGPNGMAVKAPVTGANNELKVTFTPLVGAEYVVQIFNYLEGFPIYYNLMK